MSDDDGWRWSKWRRPLRWLFALTVFPWAFAFHMSGHPCDWPSCDCSLWPGNCRRKPPVRRWHRPGRTPDG